MKQKLKVIRGTPPEVQDSLYHYSKENIVSVLGTAAIQDSLVVLIELRHKPENYEPYTGIYHKSGSEEKPDQKDSLGQTLYKEELINNLPQKDPQIKLIACEQLLKHATDLVDQMEETEDTRFVLERTDNYFEGV